MAADPFGDADEYHLSHRPARRRLDQLGDSYSETFPSHAAARAAATAAAREQRVPDRTAWIEYEDASGQWVTERADGHDRPATAVED